MWGITPLNLAAQLVPSLKGALRPHVNRLQNEHMANVCQLVNSTYERTWCSGYEDCRRKVVQAESRIIIAKLISFISGSIESR